MRRGWEQVHKGFGNLSSICSEFCRILVVSSPRMLHAAPQRPAGPSPTTATPRQASALSSEEPSLPSCVTEREVGMLHLAQAQELEAQGTPQRPAGPSPTTATPRKARAAPSEEPSAAMNREEWLRLVGKAVIAIEEGFRDAPADARLSWRDIKGAERDSTAQSSPLEMISPAFQTSSGSECVPESSEEVSSVVGRWLLHVAENVAPGRELAGCGAAGCLHRGAEASGGGQG